MTGQISRQTVASTTSRLLVTLLLAILLLAAGLAVAFPVRSAEATVGLGTAASFAVLAGETITNEGATTITGDIGLHPGSEVTGFGPGADQVTQIDGDLFVADGVALQAKNDLVTAYNDAAGRSVTATVGTELGGQDLPGGVYDSESGTFEITGTLTLDAANDPDTVWIFQMESSLLAATGSSVVFENGGDACNVFWQVGSDATLQSTATFAGTILALTSIWLGNGVTVNGRLLARNGEVTLIGDTIARPECAPVVQPTTAPTDAPTTAPTGAPTTAPTDAPTGGPTTAPTGGPTVAPTGGPTVAPAVQPTLPQGPDTGTLSPTPGSDGTGAALLVLLLGTAAAGWLFLRPLSRARVYVRRR